MTLLVHAAVSLTLLTAAAPPAHAGDEFEDAHTRAVAANPPGIRLTISLENGQKQFRIGDSIKLNYEFAASAPGKYVVGRRWYDRGGRSVLETFVVDRPHDAVDPLHGVWDLYGRLNCRDAHWSISEQIRRVAPLAPEHDSFSVTHYLRFSRPGVYRLYAITRQALDGPPPKPREPGGQPLASENIVTFNVLPQDDAAAKHELEAIAARASHVKEPEAVSEIGFRLFVIGTPEARQLALQLEARNGVITIGAVLSTLASAPSLSEAIDLLQQRLHNPAIPITESLILTLALLQTIQDEPAQSLAALSGDVYRPSDNAVKSTLLRHALADFQAGFSTLAARAGPTRALSISFLHELSRVPVCSGGLMPLAESEKLRLRSMRVEAMPDLPPFDLIGELLTISYWAKDVPGEQLLPVLRKVYERLPPNAPYERYALLRLIAPLDQDVARSWFRRDVVVGRKPFDQRVPHLELTGSPELDADLLSSLEGGKTEEMNRVAPFIGLYATAAAQGRVKAIYEIQAEHWPCPMQAGLLTYFLRIDPEYGVSKLEAAMAASRAGPAADCPSHHGLLMEMFSLHDSIELKPFLAAALRDPDPSVSARLIQTMALYEEANPLPYDLFVSRLRELREEWKDFEQKKDDPAMMQHWRSGYSELEFSIANALVRSTDTPGHLAAIREARDYCITETCRSGLQKRIDQSRIPRHD